MSKPKIYVWCNSCAHEWHVFMALSEDGVALAGHVCSDHGFAYHDMGIDEDGWKRDVYAAHYPDGFEVELIERESVMTHPGLAAALAANKARMEKSTASDQPTAESRDQPAGS